MPSQLLGKFCGRPFYACSGSTFGTIVCTPSYTTLKFISEFTKSTTSSLKSSQMRPLTRTGWNMSSWAWFHRSSCLFSSVSECIWARCASGCFLGRLKRKSITSVMNSHGFLSGSSPSQRQQSFTLTTTLTTTATLQLISRSWIRSFRPTKITIGTTIRWKSRESKAMTQRARSRQAEIAY